MNMIVGQFTVGKLTKHKLAAYIGFILGWFQTILKLPVS